MNSLIGQIFFTIFIGLLITLVKSEITQSDDKLKIFYDRLLLSDVKYCKDRTRLLPNCKLCIPGLQAVGSDICNQYVKESVDIRDEISKLTIARYGVTTQQSSRPFGLYPCKSTILLSAAFVGCLDGIIYNISSSK